LKCKFGYYDESEDEHLPDIVRMKVDDKIEVDNKTE
jgi:hypothetical protein